MPVIGLPALFACSREEPKPAAPVATPQAQAAAPVAAKEAAPKPAAPPTPDPQIPGFMRPAGAVVVVNGVEVPAALFNERFDRVVGRGAKVPADRAKRIAQNVVNKLIEEELRRQAIEKEKIALTEPEFEAAYKEYLQRWTGPDGKFNEDQFNAQLKRENQTVEQLKAQIREQRIQRKLVEKLGKLEVSEAEMREFYEQNAQTWLERESVDVRPVLIRVPDGAPEADGQKALAKARLVREELAKGADFEDVSKKHSDGVLGPLHLTKGAPERELEEAAFLLRVGQVSQPIKTRWGYYVLRLIERRPERRKAFEEVREDIRRTLSARKFYMEDRRIVDELRKAATIEERLPQ
jgi:peptidyl-prolyl cis-trans isomerase C